jgi:hypothetical protein
MKYGEDGGAGITENAFNLEIFKAFDHDPGAIHSLCHEYCPSKKNHQK